MCLNFSSNDKSLKTQVIARENIISFGGFRNMIVNLLTRGRVFRDIVICIMAVEVK